MRGEDAGEGGGIRRYDEGTRINLMTRRDGRSVALPDSKDVPQFAANFSVYLLPPNVVCLYSEDRKFFLHGKLYCALAAAIGKGGKSLQQLAEEVGRKFPPAKVEEALKALIERRYVVPVSAGSAVNGFWASLDRKSVV